MTHHNIVIRILLSLDQLSKETLGTESRGYRAPDVGVTHTRLLLLLFQKKGAFIIHFSPEKGSFILGLSICINIKSRGIKLWGINRYHAAVLSDVHREISDSADMAGFFICTKIQ
jgi:hypothetical protein